MSIAQVEVDKDIKEQREREREREQRGAYVVSEDAVRTATRGGSRVEAAIRAASCVRQAFAISQ